ncbi:MAG: MGMT family protein, partial [Nitrospinae bacterium]|nr:MGMT family protein [Nitrospinota bacterium]
MRKVTADPRRNTLVQYQQPRSSASICGGNFYTAVYRLVARIPWGRVTTYGQIARLLGHPSAARAVGYALHALPRGSDIPWQRVINAAGRISTRCNRHDEAMQRALLEAEGVSFDATGRVNLRTLRWTGPLPDEPNHDAEADQHQDAHHQQQGRHVQAEGARVQALRDPGAKLPAQH